MAKSIFEKKKFFLWSHQDHWYSFNRIV